MSVGGGDCSLLVWKLVNRSKRNEKINEMKSTSRSDKSGSFEGQSETAFQKSNAIQSDDSDSDMEEEEEEEDDGVGGYDSDIDREFKIDYVSKFNVNPLRYKKDGTSNNNNNNNNNKNNNNNNDNSDNSYNNGYNNKNSNNNMRNNRRNNNDVSTSNLLMSRMFGGGRREISEKRSAFDADSNFFVERLVGCVSG